MKKDFDKTGPSTAQSDFKPALSGQKTLLVDVDYYQAIIDDPEVSDTYKRDLIAIIGSIVIQFIDIGVGVHPVQQAMQEKAAQDKDPPPITQPEKETLPERSDA